MDTQDWREQVDIAASLATRALRERQATRESLVKAVIQELKDYLDTQEFQGKVDSVVIQVYPGSQELAASVDIQVSLENPVTQVSLAIQVSKEFPVTVDSPVRADTAVSLDSVE